MNKKQLIDFIKNSNAIENVWSTDEIENTVKAWEYVSKFDEIGLEQILECHKFIMSRLRPDIAGKLRLVAVVIASGGYVVKRCPDFTLVSGLLNEWIKKYDKGIRTAKEARLAHIGFEYIHPFEDGNGRTGRLIWLWHREKAKIKFDYIKFNKRSDYYDWFKEGKNER